MRHYLTLTAALSVAALLTSCNDHDDITARGREEVTFHVETLTATMTDDTRASLADESMTDLYVYDVTDGCIELCHQTSTDTDFGSPTLQLDYGSHTLTFVAHRGTVSGVSGGVMTFSAIRDTYGCQHTVNVQRGMTSQTVSASRLTAKCVLTIADKVPANAATLRATFSRHYDGLDLVTLGGKQSATDTGVREISITSLVGYSGSSVQWSLFTPDASTYQQNVTLDALTASGSSLRRHVMTDVSFCRNHRTTISGEFFAKSGGYQVSLDNTWGDDISVGL